MASKLRAINKGRASSVAKARQELYRSCSARIKLCIKQHFYLEAITLTESMIADRLESRLAWLNPGCREHRIFGTIGDSLWPKKKKGRLGLLQQEPDPLLKECYERVRQWSQQRNTCLHEMVKLGEGDDRTWSTKYEAAKQVAREGWSCFRQLDGLVKKANRAANPKQESISSHPSCLMESIPQ